MGLLKTAATVAVASSVHGRIQRRQQARWTAQDQASAAAVPAPPPPASAATPAQPQQAYTEPVPPREGPAAQAPATEMGERLAQDVATLTGHGTPLRWLVLDCAAIDDIDYTASTVLAKAVEHLHKRHICLMFSSVLGPVRGQIDRYGISADGYYDTPGEALEAFHAAQR